MTSKIIINMRKHPEFNSSQGFTERLSAYNEIGYCAKCFLDYFYLASSCLVQCILRNYSYTVASYIGEYRINSFLSM